MPRCRRSITIWNSSTSGRKKSSVTSRLKANSKCPCHPERDCFAAALLAMTALCCHCERSEAISWKRATYGPRGLPMYYSTERILTSHAGSLPRPPELRELVVARTNGQPYDAAALDRRLGEAVAEVVKQ